MTIAEWDDVHPTSKPLTVSNLAKSGGNYDRAAGTLRDILDKIDPNCLSLLQSGGSNLRSYVSDLLANSLFAVGDFQTNIAAFTATAGTNLQPGDAAMVVNNNGAFFNAGFTLDHGKIRGNTREADVFILLHELGHALGALNFQDDYNKNQAGKANDKLVDQNCDKTLRKFQ